MTYIIDGKQIANNLLERVQSSAWGRIPRVKIVVMGDNQASSVYVNHKVRVAAKLGFDVEVLRPSTQDELHTTIHSLNSSSECDGFIVQLPLPDRTIENSVVDSINPNKDIDGLTLYNIGAVAVKSWDECKFVSCTALAAISTISSYLGDIRLVKGLNITILGFTRLVGIPLAHILSDMGATVSIVRSNVKKETLVSLCNNCDIVISSVGKPGVLPDEVVFDDTILIDVGISKVDGKVVGDFLPHQTAQSRAHTPVPGGVGVCTVACLMLNSVIASNNLKAFDVYEQLIFKP